MSTGSSVIHCSPVPRPLATLAVDAAIQTLGGNGMTTEYGVATLLGGVRAGRIAPVSREMILNFVAQHVLGLDKSY